MVNEDLISLLLPECNECSADLVGARVSRQTVELRRDARPRNDTQVHDAPALRAPAGAGNRRHNSRLPGPDRRQRDERLPRAAFFPANTLNTSVIEGAFGVPVPVYRSLIALVIVAAVVRTLDVFDLEIDRTLSAVEEAQVLDAERARLARDLHDRTLQSVYAAGLIVTTCFEVRRQEGRTRSAESLSRAMLALDRAVEDLRSHIAELSSPPTRVSLEQGVLDRIHASAVEAVADTTIDVALPADVRLSARTVGHVLAITSEALSNAARHSGAQHVAVGAHIDGGDLHLSVVDDGRGLPIDYVSGYGIENMHERARLLGGDLRILTVPGKGTRLHLVVPLAADDGQVPS